MVNCTFQSTVWFDCTPMCCCSYHNLVPVSGFRVFPNSVSTHVIIYIFRALYGNVVPVKSVGGGVLNSLKSLVKMYVQTVLNQNTDLSVASSPSSALHTFIASDDL